MDAYDVLGITMVDRMLRVRDESRHISHLAGSSPKEFDWAYKGRGKSTEERWYVPQTSHAELSADRF